MVCQATNELGLNTSLYIHANGLTCTNTQTHVVSPVFLGHTEDADVDCPRFHGEEFLYHHGHVSVDFVLCICGRHNVWMCEVW